MRFHLQALAVAPIFLLIVTAFSRSWESDLSSRDDELEYRQYGAPSEDLVDRALGALLSADTYLEARSPQLGPYRSNAPPKTKLSAAAQKDRKADKKAAVGAATQANREKKDRHKAFAALPGNIRTKTPKNPKPLMQKGQPQSAKSQAKQAVAKQKIADRKAAGAAKFAPAKAAYGQMTNLPGRKDTFGKKGAEQATGRQVRNAVFNSKHFSPNGPIINGLSKQAKKTNTLAAPKLFENRVQGPPGNRGRPIGKMRQPGTEYPIGQGKGGFQGGTDAKGTMRVITQGNKFKGVVAHDASKNKKDPGYMDHFRVSGRKPKQPMNIGSGFRALERLNK